MSLSRKGPLVMVRSILLLVGILVIVPVWPAVVCGQVNGGKPATSPAQPPTSNDPFAKPQNNQGEKAKPSENPVAVKPPVGNVQTPPLSPNELKVKKASNAHRAKF